MGNVSAQEIALFLNSELIGNNINISSVSSLNKILNNSIVFSKNNENDINRPCLVLVRKDSTIKGIATYIKVDNPRLSFAKIVQNYFIKKNSFVISSSSIIAKTVVLGDNVTIGENCVIGDNVQIGRNTIINHNVIIFDNTIIGNNCYIKSGSVIGEDGFGFDFEEDKKPIRIPHLGSVIIGDNVEIGAKNTIARGTLDDTIIEDDVKIDDQVHVAHNCYIGKKTIITACSEISGSVKIGENCWIGPNSSIMQKIKIGDNVTIGLGSIINTNIENSKKIMGLESLELRKLLKAKRKIDYGK